MIDRDISLETTRKLFSYTLLFESFTTYMTVLLVYSSATRSLEKTMTRPFVPQYSAAGTWKFLIFESII